MDITDFFNELVEHRTKYKNQRIVIKVGGELSKDEDVLRSICKQAAFLSNSIYADVSVVHGGRTQIDDLLEKENIQPARDTATGLRITDRETLDVTDRALLELNGKIVRMFLEQSQNSIPLGMAGYNGKLIEASPLSHYTGEATEVNTDFFNILFSAKAPRYVPIISPVCWNSDTKGEEHRLNVNADNVACIVAEKLGAIRLIMCTDVPGVLDKQGNLISGLSTDSVDGLINDGTVTGGMIPKLKAAVQAAHKMKEGGVVLLDGRKHNSILAELLSKDGVGTLIRRPENIQDPLNPGQEPA